MWQDELDIYKKYAISESSIFFSSKAIVGLFGQKIYLYDNCKVWKAISAMTNRRLTLFCVLAF